MQKRSWVKRYVMGCIGPASVALSAAAAGGAGFELEVGGCDVWCNPETNQNRGISL